MCMYNYFYTYCKRAFWCGVATKQWCSMSQAAQNFFREYGHSSDNSKKTKVSSISVNFYNQDSCWNCLPWRKFALHACNVWSVFFAVYQDGVSLNRLHIRLLSFSWIKVNTNCKSWQPTPSNLLQSECTTMNTISSRNSSWTTMNTIIFRNSSCTTMNAI